MGIKFWNWLRRPLVRYLPAKDDHPFSVSTDVQEGLKIALVECNCGRQHYIAIGFVDDTESE